MRYLILVSHGTFAPGLHSALTMLAGSEREDILSTSLEDGMSGDAFSENFKKLTENITSEDEVILMGDIIGGSPLTMAMNVLGEKNLLAKTKVLGGMNLPMALNGVLLKDDEDMEMDMIISTIITEARQTVKELVLETQADEDDI
ncbi:MAG: PTS sugar transporter subunit IIA [Lachnospiraceae bacterium]